MWPSLYKLSGILLCASLLCACTAPLSPTATVTATSIIIPTSSPTFTPTATASPPVPTLAPTRTPKLPDLAPFLTPTTVSPSAPFSDCARIPGLAGCDTSTPRQAGYVAFYDLDQSHLVGLDLRTGQGWAMPLPQPQVLEWSPDGSQLLVTMNTPQGEAHYYEYVLLTNDGKLLRQFTQEEFVTWQPQGATLRDDDEPKIVRSQDGAEAWLESTDAKKWLHFRSSANTDWKIAEIVTSPWEWPSELVAWIPGTANILLTNGPMSVEQIVRNGHPLYMFDTQSEKLMYLRDFHGHLDPQSFTQQGTETAMIQLNFGFADDTLAILNGKTGEISHPLPRESGDVQAYSLRQIAWQPGSANNTHLVMMVKMVKTNMREKQPPANPLFPTDGIYLYDRSSGQSQLLRDLPEDVLGGNFQWSADGQYLFYCLGPASSPSTVQTGLYVRHVPSGREWLLIDHVPNVNLWLSYIHWNLIAVYVE